MSARRVGVALALVLSFGACGGGGGGGSEVPDGQTLVVITVIIDAGVPEVNQIWVAAHSSDPTGDADVYFPTTPQGPIASGSTLGLLLPDTYTGNLDLVLRGLDTGHNAVARGNGQAMLIPGGRVDKTITLSACGTSGC